VPDQTLDRSIPGTYSAVARIRRAVRRVVLSSSWPLAKKKSSSVEILSIQPWPVMSETHFLGMAAANDVAPCLTAPKAGTSPSPPHVRQFGGRNLNYDSHNHDQDKRVAQHGRFKMRGQNAMDRQGALLAHASQMEVRTELFRSQVLSFEITGLRSQVLFTMNVLSCFSYSGTKAAQLLTNEK
jgi:hypothetical protein